jgi:hypothetical protein
MDSLKGNMGGTRANATRKKYFDAQHCHSNVGGRLLKEEVELGLQQHRPSNPNTLNLHEHISANHKIND